MLCHKTSTFTLAGRATMNIWILVQIITVALAASSQSGILGASLSFQDAVLDILPVEKSTSTIREPAPRLVVYIQTFSDTVGNPLSLLPLLEHDTKVTHCILGAIHLHEIPGEIMLNNEPFGASSYDQTWEEVTILQRNGVKVMGLLGGAAPGTYARLSGTDEEFESYYKPLLKLVKQYRLDGLDIDIEEATPLTSALRLLKRLRKDLQPSFILTMAPLATALSAEDGDNLSGFSYAALDRLAVNTQHDTKTSTNTTHLVDWYNAQFYGGYARSPWLYDSIVRAGFSSERLVMGVTTSAAGYPNGFTPLKKLTNVIGELKKKYGELFGGVSAWEYWDAGSSDKDMGMRSGGEPWRWVQRIARSLFGEKENAIRGNSKKALKGSECWRQCMRGM